jgi:hypothetical protein
MVSMVPAGTFWLPVWIFKAEDDEGAIAGCVDSGVDGGDVICARTGWESSDMLSVKRTILRNDALLLMPATGQWRLMLENMKTFLDSLPSGKALTQWPYYSPCLSG